MNSKALEDITINFNECILPTNKKGKCIKLNRRPISKECKLFQVFNSFKAKNALPNEMQVLKCMTLMHINMYFFLKKEKKMH